MEEPTSGRGNTGYGLDGLETSEQGAQQQGAGVLPCAAWLRWHRAVAAQLAHLGQSVGHGVKGQLDVAAGGHGHSGVGRVGLAAAGRRLNKRIQHGASVGDGGAQRLGHTGVDGLQALCPGEAHLVDALQAGGGRRAGTGWAQGRCCCRAANQQAAVVHATSACRLHLHNPCLLRGWCRKSAPTGRSTSPPRWRSEQLEDNRKCQLKMPSVQLQCSCGCSATAAGTGCCKRACTHGSAPTQAGGKHTAAGGAER